MRVLLITPQATRARAAIIARWARALVPAVVLVVVPYEGSEEVRADPEGEVVLRMEEIPSGPLSFVSALAKTLRKA